MTQAQVEVYKRQLRSKSDACIQTNDTQEMYLYFSYNKTGRLYYSSVFREHVLALNISTQATKI
jgi:hypothetical protein